MDVLTETKTEHQDGFISSVGVERSALLLMIGISMFVFLVLSVIGGNTREAAQPTDAPAPSDTIVETIDENSGAEIGILPTAEPKRQ